MEIETTLNQRRSVTGVVVSCLLLIFFRKHPANSLVVSLLSLSSCRMSL